VDGQLAGGLRTLAGFVLPQRNISSSRINQYGHPAIGGDLFNITDPLRAECGGLSGGVMDVLDDIARGG
jgi:hypothetical protein